MPSISSELISFIRATPAITALIGAGTACRVFSRRGKQDGALPYIIFEKFAGSSFQHLQGDSGIASNRFQIDAFGATEGDAHALGVEIKRAISGKRQLMGSTLVSEHGEGSFTNGQEESTEKGSAKYRYFESRDYIFTFNEGF